MKLIKRASIGVKMMVLVSALFLLCTGLSAAIYWNILESTSRKELERISAQTLSTINDGINSQLDYIHNFSIRLMMENSFQMLAGRIVNEPKLESQIKIERVLYHITEYSDLIEAAFFIDIEGKLYGVKRSGEAVANRILDETAGQFLSNADYRGRWDILPGALLPETDSDISMVFDLQSTADFSHLGIVIIQMDMNKLSETFGDTLRRYHLNIQIRDNEGTVIKAFEDSEWRRKEDYCMTYVTAENEGCIWEYAGAVSTKEMDDAYLKSRKITLFVLGIDSCALFAGIYIITRGFLRPFKRLAGALDETGEKMVKVHLDSETKEVRQLEKAYNHMTDRIEKLLSRVVAEQKNLRKMELSLLQAQINPHFLYNTLNDISALVVTGRRQQACHAIKAFSNFYRRTLSQGKDIITLKEELMIVNDYLEVQKIRFEPIFRVEQYMDETLLDFKVPKLLLQPFVENAIYHGLRPSKKEGILGISVRKEGEDGICLTVKDNGAGMSEDLLEDILTGNREAAQNHGFGLWKTIERIRLYFGEASRVDIHSYPQQGTEIVIYVKRMAGHGEDMGQ